jgi:hypothetical protein
MSISKKVLEDFDKEHNSINSASITEFSNNSYVLGTKNVARYLVALISKGEYTLLDLTTNKEK